MATLLDHFCVNVDVTQCSILEPMLLLGIYANEINIYTFINSKSGSITYPKPFLVLCLSMILSMSVVVVPIFFSRNESFVNHLWMSNGIQCVLLLYSVIISFTDRNLSPLLLSVVRCFRHVTWHDSLCKTPMQGTVEDGRSGDGNSMLVRSSSGRARRCRNSWATGNRLAWRSLSVFSGFG